MSPFSRMTFGEKALALLLLAALGLWALSALWSRFWSVLPWSAERRAERATAALDVAVKDGAARKLELEGMGAAAVRVERHYQTIETARAQLAAVEREIDHEDADTPLREDVARALRAHDGQLCQLGPACDGAGSAAATGAPGRVD